METPYSVTLNKGNIDYLYAVCPDTTNVLEYCGFWIISIEIKRPKNSFKLNITYLIL